MTTRRAVVAYPRWTLDDAAWIEALRALHDPQAHRLAAHATLFFPAAVAAADLVAAAREIARTHVPFELAFDRAVAQRDPDASRVFLVPSRGAAELVALHDALYGGALRAHLRMDLPYVPHVTIAARSDHDVCASLVGELEARGVRAEAPVAAVDVLEVLESGGIAPIATIPLGVPPTA